MGDTNIQPSDTKQEEYKLSLSGGGITIKDKVISEDKALQIVASLMSSSVNAHTTGANSAGASRTSIVPGTTSGEFLESVGAKTIPEKIVAIGVYILDEEKLKNFKREDILQRLLDAGEPEPGNFPRDFKKAVKNKWIAPANRADSTFIATGTGRSAVARKFARG